MKLHERIFLDLSILVAMATLAWMLPWDLPTIIFVNNDFLFLILVFLSFVSGFYGLSLVYAARVNEKDLKVLLLATFLSTSFFTGIVVFLVVSRYSPFGPNYANVFVAEFIVFTPPSIVIWKIYQQKKIGKNPTS